MSVRLVLVAILAAALPTVAAFAQSMSGDEPPLVANTLPEVTLLTHSVESQLAVVIVANESARAIGVGDSIFHGYSLVDVATDVVLFADSLGNLAYLYAKTSSAPSRWVPISKTPPEKPKELPNTTVELNLKTGEIRKAGGGS